MLHQPSALTMTTPISVLLVDDEPDFRKGLCALLDFYSDTDEITFRVVGQAASLDQAVALTKEQKPALILLDLNLGQTDGIQFLTQYSELKQSGKVLVLSGHAEDKWVFHAMQAGARGYLVKQNLSTQLYQAITTVMQEHIYLTPEAASGFFRLFHFYRGQSLKTSSKIHLTKREREVLQCLAEGDTNATIADRLTIEKGTVKFYLRDIFRKLKVKNRTQAVLVALREGIVK